MLRNADYAHIEVRPLTGALGGEVAGVDLSRPLRPEVVADVKQAFLDHLVLVFRDQSLDEDALMRFSELFGRGILPWVKEKPFERSYVVPLEREAATPRTVRVAGDEWHSDLTGMERPPLGFALYCQEAPDYGGDTMFSNLYLAYEHLSPKMKQICEQLTVIHSPAGMFGYDAKGRNGKRPFQLANGSVEETAEMLASLEAEVEHPLVRIHPETGRKLLFVSGPWSLRMAHMSLEEGLPLLDMLQRLATRPDLTCRVRYEKGTLVLQDNRCTQHYAINDYEGFSRRMLRTQIASSDRPYGPAMPKADHAVAVTG